MARERKRQDACESGLGLERERERESLGKLKVRGKEEEEEEEYWNREERRISYRNHGKSGPIRCGKWMSWEMGQARFLAHPSFSSVLDMERRIHRDQGSNSSLEDFGTYIHAYTQTLMCALVFARLDVRAVRCLRCWFWGHDDGVSGKQDTPVLWYRCFRAKGGEPKSQCQ